MLQVCGVSVFSPEKVGINRPPGRTDCAILNGPLDKLAVEVFGKLPGAEDEAIGDDGLVVHWAGLGRLIGLDWYSRHDECWGGILLLGRVFRAV